MIVSPQNGEGSKGGEDLLFSELLACPEHGTTLAEIEPRTFSFNTPHGACPECQGLGSKLEIDPDRILPDRSMSIAEGAVAAGEWSNQRRERRGYYWQLVEAVADAYDIDLDAPVASLPKKKLDLILYGTQGEAGARALPEPRGSQGDLRDGLRGHHRQPGAALPGNAVGVHALADPGVHVRAAVPDAARASACARKRWR